MAEIVDLGKSDKGTSLAEKDISPSERDATLSERHMSLSERHIFPGLSWQNGNPREAGTEPGPSGLPPTSREVHGTRLKAIGP